ncbi:bifunctional 4-hydroxy-2-oxoglutarate aldolase/2-dehydro-3-deoxy-phosphogluconate aldolase [Texcoconibacillus texcoconensis]|uniref:2-dehydro-3-deoxyphosphogluconate aldolase/(4S)-4-hydroxy-2-oxoglutarate aldolase n=1 Tax=Texcoconibacillus texcoconensis TaxID=1095777 RepID=A0A840QR44_9BACI|nr:bifunctional 4-hydroxy-2-oxoglutarate aldolase/2-dehydro-3-deoxy-phosphogluconate aldolase [Texcoconibacillus texcoconensis]MBB5173835.1 2-dehydro-3-deoxyphosphogluconate aldolase/(4S)-4-hydroxy-2-oxoglutarate aldolase [Texcoconibacillus texcoconensis]
MVESGLKKLEKSPIIAVLRRPPKDQVFSIVEAIINGGITNLELTMEGPESLTVLKELNERFSDRAWIGAGTVLDETTAINAIHAGASFIFSPNYNENVVKAAKRYGVTAIPGVLTPTEIVNAVEAGADAVKIFPASTLGPKYIKELKGPLPHIPMVPTGGVGEDNIGEYMQAGVLACGVGGSLLDKQLIADENYEELTNRAKRLVDATGL